MKIVRYSDGAGKIGYASEQADGLVLAIQGDILVNFQVIREKAQIKKRLAPLVPTMIWCLGLNYRFHAEETNSKMTCERTHAFVVGGLNTQQRQSRWVYMNVSMPDDYHDTVRMPDCFKRLKG
jgi:2-keto-4-pentenoate hydratase/2-oxohepta-3-ene-1,7-dioic acid hydratase in catechol pathway